MGMKLLLDVSKYQFTVSMQAKEKSDQNGRQKVDRTTNEPLWVTQVMALSPETGAAVLDITVAGPMPKVNVGQPVTPVELEALPWNQGDRNGVAYRAKQLMPLNAPKP